MRVSVLCCYLSLLSHLMHRVIAPSFANIPGSLEYWCDWHADVYVFVAPPSQTGRGRDGIGAPSQIVL